MLKVRLSIEDDASTKHVFVVLADSSALDTVWLHEFVQAAWERNDDATVVSHEQAMALAAEIDAGMHTTPAPELPAAAPAVVEEMRGQIADLTSLVNRLLAAKPQASAPAPQPVQTSAPASAPALVQPVLAPDTATASEPAPAPQAEAESTEHATS